MSTDDTFIIVIQVGVDHSSHLKKILVHNRFLLSLPTDVGVYSNKD